MIHGFLDMVPQFLRDMNNTGFDFYPTGSRAFNQQRPGSNWNFFAQYSQEVADFMEAYGADQIGDHDDFNEMGIIETYQCVTSGVVIVIHLVKDAAHKLRVQEFLKELYPRGIPGSVLDREAVWKTAMAMGTLYNRDNAGPKSESVVKTPVRRVRRLPGGIDAPGIK